MRLAPDAIHPTITAALDAGVKWFDTARAYDNEAAVARATAGRGQLVTKCGMIRAGWVPDGRASSILADARASADALGRPPDLLLLHAPDPRVALTTSLRALVRARDEGLTRAIGLSNVTRRQLDELTVPIAAVEVALGLADDAPVRGGIVAWCKERGIPLLAHSPLGGPTKGPRLLRDPVLQTIAKRHSGATTAMIAIAYLLALDPSIVPLVGARTPEAAVRAVAAERIVLTAGDLDLLDARFPGLAMARAPRVAPPPKPGAAEVVLVMGLAGSGKTRLAETYVAGGYTRLNRDLLGGTLKGIAQRLAQVLAAGEERIVLDNTYLTRVQRSEVLRVAHAARARVRCIHVDTPASDAQVNLAIRMLDRHGELLGGAELAQRSKRDPGLFAPTTLFRMERQLELPAADEGFASIETMAFVRDPTPGAPATFIPLDRVFHERAGDPALREGAADYVASLDTPLCLFGWRPETTETWRTAAISLLPERPGILELAVCTHAAGPPVCWCRPPLPGLWLAFARRHGVDPRASVVDSESAVHRRMAETLGLRVSSSRR
jgi:diketogulonate reductase-like aldo/keto reductase